MSERTMKGSEAVQGLLHTEPLLFEHGSRGRNGASIPTAGVPDYLDIPAFLRRQAD